MQVIDAIIRVLYRVEDGKKGNQQLYKCYDISFIIKRNIISRQRYVITTFFNNFTEAQQSQIYNMVKLKDFCGAVFHPQEYTTYLKNNIQHLESTPMSKKFKTAQMLSSGKIKQEQQPFFYIYRQNYLNHVSYGIMAEISIQDYHNNYIKRHEKTLIRPGLDHSSYIKQHVGPVVVGYREDQTINEMILNLTKTKQKFSQWTTNDGREHSLWKFTACQAQISKSFTLVESFYILDGHHRLQAAYKNYLSKTQKRQVDLWIQAIVYSSSQIMVHAQHRAIQNTSKNAQSVKELLKLKSIEVTELTIGDIKCFDVNQELENYEIILKSLQKLYGINFKNCSRNVLQKITSYRLQNEIFQTCFDQQSIQKLRYIPGIMEQGYIFEYDIVFFVKQPKIETLFEIADAEVKIPPKSTWIEPKPCSHMVIRLLN